jgi:hypothetical protein
MCVIQYTERCIVITGSDTKDYQDTLRAIGGIFNPHLKCGPGWIFPKREEKKVLESLIGILNPGSQCEMTYKPKEGSKCCDFLQNLDLHTFYTREQILELLGKAGYKYPSKFFRQISTANSGGNVPHLLQQTEQGWKLIHNCIQECSCCRDEPQFSEEVEEEPSGEEESEEEEESDEEEDEEESAEQSGEEEESSVEEDYKNDPDYIEPTLTETKGDSVTKTGCVSRAELNVANLRIRDLQHQINQLKKYVFKISTDAVNEVGESNEVTQSDEQVEENEQVKENEQKRCARCVTM